MQDTSEPSSVNPFSADDYAPPTTSSESNTDAQRQVAERLSDITKPLYPQGDEATDRYRFDVPDDLQPAFDDICADAAPDLTNTGRMGDDDWEVFRHILRHLVRQMPMHVANPNHADLQWAWLRCICAGAGYTRHADCCSLFEGEFSWFPWDAGEDHAEWIKNLTAAHSTSGYPASIARIDFGDVSRLYPTVAYDVRPPRWMCHLAVIHYLKHCRYCTLGEYPGIVSMYMGDARRMKISASGQALGRNNQGELAKSLRGGRGKHAPSVALGYALDMPATDLMRTTPASDLDPRMIMAPQAHKVSYAPNRAGFIRTGIGVEGVWIASHGKVTRTYGTHKLALTTHIPQPTDTNVARFASIVPPSYSVNMSPSMMVTQAFPNIVTGHQDNDAWHAYLSAIILSGLIDGNSAFHRERPFIVMQPNGDTIDLSTGTGKSTLAIALAQIWAPRLQQATRVGQGAPAQRAAAAVIEQHGTIALDEFQWPKDDTALTSETNMLAMATGNCSGPGKVYSNDSTDLVVTAPVTLTAKVWDGKLDLYRRTFPIYLDPFSKQQLTSSNYHDILSGKWSMSVRLACLHMIDTLNLEDLMAKTKIQGALTPFPAIRLLASYLMVVYQIEPDAAIALERIDNLHQWSTREQERKLERCTASGMRAEARGQGRAIIDIDTMIRDMTSDEFDLFVALVTSQPGGAATPKQIFKAYQESIGKSSAPEHHVFEDLTGDKGVSGQRISRAVSDALKRIMPTPHDAYQMPGVFGVLDNWHFVREPDRSRMERYTIEQRTTSTNPLTNEENNDEQPEEGTLAG